MRTATIHPRRRRPIRVYAGLGDLAGWREDYAAAVLALKSFVSMASLAERFVEGMDAAPANEQVDLSSLRAATRDYLGAIGRASTLLMRARGEFNRRKPSVGTPAEGVDLDTWQIASVLDSIKPTQTMLGELEELRVRLSDAQGQAIEARTKRQVANGTRETPILATPTLRINWGKAVGDGASAVSRVWGALKAKAQDAGSRFGQLSSMALLIGVGLVALVLVGKVTR